jgi:DNA-binding GntR family transcriptional regulator
MSSLDSFFLLLLFVYMDPNIQNIISNTLEEEIINGQLMPGSLLQQEELADRFGVSRQPVRAALDILGAKGLAVRRPNRTIEVCGLHSEAAQEALAIRKLLEPEALKASIMNLTAQNILIAKQALERFEIETKAENLAQHDTDFHLALYCQCENKILLDLISDLRRTNRRAYLGQPLGSGTRDICIKTHRDLLEAVSAKDSPRATEILIQHLDISKERDA